jgi:hypothetical protein
MRQDSISQHAETSVNSSTPVTQTATQAASSTHATHTPRVARATRVTDTTAIHVDSLVTDSLATDSLALDSLAMVKMKADSAALAATIPPKRNGLEATPHLTDLNQSSGTLTLIVLLFLLLAVGYKHISHLLSASFSELWTIRHRANVFDEPLGGTAPLRVLLAAQFIIYAGLSLYIGASAAEYTFQNAPATFYWPSQLIPVPEHTFSQAALYIGAIAIYYVFQLIAYNTLGYTFSTNELRAQLIRGFNASQALLGMALIIPTLVMIFYPASTPIMLTIEAALYLIARIIFISKGFRIFYHKIGSLLYFILYLCTLEIIPIILSLKFALFLLK